MHFKLSFPAPKPCTEGLLPQHRTDAVPGHELPLARGGSALDAGEAETGSELMDRGMIKCCFWWDLVPVKINTVKSIHRAKFVVIKPRWEQMKHLIIVIYGHIFCLFCLLYLRYQRFIHTDQCQYLTKSCKQWGYCPETKVVWRQRPQSIADT